MNQKNKHPFKIKNALEKTKNNPVFISLGIDIKQQAAAWFWQLVTAAFLVVFSVSMALIVFKVLAVGGIEAVLAELMATTCVNSAAVPCDYNILLAGVGLTLTVTLPVVILALRFLRDIERADILKDNPLENYNEKMAAVLRDIQRLHTVENIKGLADWKGIPVTTMQRWVKEFEKDGLVKITTNGKGKPVQVEAIKT